MFEQAALQGVTLAKHGLTLGMKPTTPKRYPAKSRSLIKPKLRLNKDTQCQDSYAVGKKFKSSSIEVEYIIKMSEMNKRSLPLVVCTVYILDIQYSNCSQDLPKQLDVCC